jgi:hypothetical protein
MTRHGLRTILALGFTALLPPAAAFPETLLLCVTETVDGNPSPPPLPASEGIWDGLFESGHIIFDTEEGKPPLPLSTLVELAVSGGARYILAARVAFVRTPRDAGPAEISARAGYSLYTAKTGGVVGEGTITDDNRGREKKVDLAKLGFELGNHIADKVSKLMAKRDPKR